MPPSNDATVILEAHMSRTPDTIALNATAWAVTLATIAAIGLFGYAIQTAVHELSAATIAQDLVRIAH